MEVISNGTRIIYDDVGQEEPVPLSMSGWCAPRTYYNDLVALCSSNRRCLVVDWPGHGDSQFQREILAKRESVEAATEVLVKSNVRRVVPVAVCTFRMGRNRAPAAIRRDGARIGAIRLAGVETVAGIHGSLEGFADA